MSEITEAVVRLERLLQEFRKQYRPPRCPLCGAPMGPVGQINSERRAQGYHCRGKKADCWNTKQGTKARTRAQQHFHDSRVWVPIAKWHDMKPLLEEIGDFLDLVEEDQQ